MSLSDEESVSGRKAPSRLWHVIAHWAPDPTIKRSRFFSETEYALGGGNVEELRNRKWSGLKLQEGAYLFDIESVEYWDYIRSWVQVFPKSKP